MNNQMVSTPLTKDRSSKKAWLIVAIVFGTAVVCCILLIAGASIVLFYVNLRVPYLPDDSSSTVYPGDPAPISGISSSSISAILDPARPAWGPVDLQRGFSPDPFVIGLGSDGVLDTSATDLPCGFTTEDPAFAFNLGGGASEGFLRMSFSTGDSQEATLIVHTPDDHWICGGGPSAGVGMDPSVELEYAPSGQYAVWLGAAESGAIINGMLSITGSESNTP